MRIWSVQPEYLYEKLKIEKILHCDPTQSELITECGFGSAYDWLVEQMISRVGPPPIGVKYPFWAWHTLEWKRQKPDLRRREFRAYNGDQACIELEIPDTSFRLSKMNGRIMGNIYRLHFGNYALNRLLPSVILKDS